MKRAVLTLDEVKQKTKEVLGLSDDEDLSYIDEDYFADESDVQGELDALLIPSPCYGHRVSYGHREGVGPTYELSTAVGWATSEGAACGNARGWLAQSMWHHSNTGTYCGGSGQPAYRRVSRFTR